MRVPALGCGVLEKSLSKKRGIILKKKNAFRIVSFDSMDCCLDSEHILRVSSKYIQ